jgi:enoyl-CoA hydratase/carnithine racemase
MDEVLYERKGAGAWLCLDRPEQLNALNPGTMSQLAHHIDRARVDNEVRALVITGSGRAFCAGGDLTVARELAEMDPPCGQQFLIDFAAGRLAPRRRTDAEVGTVWVDCFPRPFGESSTAASTVNGTRSQPVCAVGKTVVTTI